MKTSLRTRLSLALLATGWLGQATPATAQTADAEASVGGDFFGDSAEADADVSANAEATAEEAPAPAADEEEKPEERELSRVQNTLYGTTGLLRVAAADSDDVGTFRVGVLANYYSGSEFLCPNCSRPDGSVSTSGDSVTQVGTRIGLSFTPASFLEGYGGLRFQTTENTQGLPPVVNIVGDANLGLKAFMPTDPHRIYGFGGAAELFFTNQPGAVGVDSASVRLRGLATLDLNRQLHEEDRIPLRAHLNLGYRFDNTGVLADDTEAARARVLGDSTRITRIERFGHDIDRVDTFDIGIGVEGTFGIVQPFLAWTLDIPVNRQGYTCDTRIRSAGDGCLDQAGFSAVPSRITIGARGYPWFENWTHGLALLAAFDIGTGATGTFIEEVAPELPWSLHLGLAYGFDTEPKIEHVEVEKIVEAPKPPERRIMGAVVKEGTEEGIAGATLRWEGLEWTGMVTNVEGKFESRTLDPGAYTFAVSAEGYEDATCPVTVPEKNEQGGEDVSAWVECPLKALPQTATLEGTVRDATTTVPVTGAAVKIVDPIGRSLTLNTDAQGGFRFENVKAGTSTLTISGEGYLPTTVEYTLEPRKDRKEQVNLNPEPANPNVVVTDKEIKIKEQIQFLHGSAEIGRASDALVQEIAKTLHDHPEITQIEVQGHTDDSGTPDFNQGLSQRRAEAVRAALIKNGVEAGRLTAKGYGQNVPLAPNTSDKNRAKNRRVQFVIQAKN